MLLIPSGCHSDHIIKKHAGKAVIIVDMAAWIQMDPPALQPLNASLYAVLLNMAASILRLARQGVV